MLGSAGFLRRLTDIHYKEISNYGQLKGKKYKILTKDVYLYTIIQIFKNVWLYIIYIVVINSFSKGDI